MIEFWHNRRLVSHWIKTSFGSFLDWWDKKEKKTSTIKYHKNIISIVKHGGGSVMVWRLQDLHELLQWRHEDLWCLPKSHRKLFGGFCPEIRWAFEFCRSTKNHEVYCLKTILLRRVEQKCCPVMWNKWPAIRFRIWFHLAKVGSDILFTLESLFKTGFCIVHGVFLLNEFCSKWLHFIDKELLILFNASGNLNKHLFLYL